MQKDLARMRNVSIGTISLVLVVVSASSLISMYGLFQVEKIVNQDLYRYGLQFSYAWAMPYWTITKLMFAAGWFNIIAAVAFHIYMLAYGQKETKQFEPKIEKETCKPETLETIKSTNKEETEPKPETKPTEPVEQQKEQEPKPTETVEEKPKETPTPVIETQTQTESKQPEQTEQLKTEPEETPQEIEVEEKKEETTTAVTETPSGTQTESNQPEQTEQPMTEPKESPNEADTPQEIELQPSGTSVL